jgi:hypothetical protein
MATALERINVFFRERSRGSRDFAKVVLSLRGKWELIKSKLPTTDSDGHLRFLQENFERYLFTVDDLKGAVESAVVGYVQATHDLENQLLRDIRGEVSMPEAAEALPVVTTEALFQGQYAKMVSQVVPDASEALKAGLAKTAVSFVASEVGTHLVMRILIAVSTRLGVSAGLLAGGAGSSWATFGVGLVVAIVLDIAVDWLLDLAGYDPEGKVAEKVNGTLDRVRALIVGGDPEAVEVYAKLRRLEQDDPDAQVRADCKAAADRIEPSGNLGLEWELKRLNALRARIRREALQRLILRGERL